MNQLEVLKRYVKKYHYGLNIFMFDIRLIMNTKNQSINRIELSYNKNFATEDQMTHAVNYFGTEGRFAIQNKRKVFILERGRIRLLIFQEKDIPSKEEREQSIAYAKAMKVTSYFNFNTNSPIED